MQDWSNQPFLFIPAFILFWIAVGFVIALIDGWRSLADRYADNSGQFDGKKWYLQSGAMRWSTHYNNVLTVGVDRRGLYLGVMFLFRAGHPPVYVPWQDVEIHERRGWIFSYVRFDFRALPGVYLIVSKKLGQRVAEAAGQRISGERASGPLNAL